MEQIEEKSPLVNIDTDISDAWAQYMHLFKYDCDQFKYYFTSNSVVDYFGFIIRGSLKIHKYLKRQICDRYEHINFGNPIICDPIEIHENHMITKTTSSNNQEYMHQLNKVTASLSQLKTYAESDIKEENCNTPTEPAQINYENPFRRNRVVIISDSSDSEDEIVRKDDGAGGDSLSASYSPLQYFEVYGKLMHKKSGYQCCERLVRIRMSFRRRMIDQDLEFALVIYEPQPGTSFSSTPILFHSSSEEIYDKSSARKDDEDLPEDDDDDVIDGMDDVHFQTYIKYALIKPSLSGPRRLRNLPRKIHLNPRKIASVKRQLNH